MLRLLVSAPTPFVPAFTPTPTCPPVDLRPLAGCERWIKRRLLPTPPKEASFCQRPGGVSVGTCCRCNGSGKCKRCMCVVSVEPCTNCLPSHRGHCQNYANAQGPSSSSRVPAPDKALSVIDRAATHQALLPPPTPRSESSPTENFLVSHSLAPPALPSLSAILLAKSPILQHVPKGARDAWAGLVGDVFCNIRATPSDVSVWCKLFMLSRCILSRTTGERLR